MFVDTHLHVADSKFDSDRDAVIERATQAGVSTFIEIAESPATWDAAIRLAEKYSFVYASLGIHPHHAHEAGPAEWPELRHRLQDHLKNPKVVAIGEFGLDYFRMRNTKDQQHFIFREQLELAKEFHKPIVIHCREGETLGAHADLQKTLFDYYPNTAYEKKCGQPNGVIHCFSGTWEDAQEYLLHGFMLGVDGPITYPNSKALQENVRRLPLERIVLETDSPYLPPQSHRGQRNDPSFIPVIAEAIGALRLTTTEQVARQTTENAKALFRI